MKKIIYFAFVLLLTGAVTTQAQDAFISKSFTGKTVSEVFCRTSSGGITIEGGSGTARVELFIKGDNGRSLSENEIKERLSNDYKLVIDVEGDKLIATAEPKDKFFNWRNALQMSFRIYVPQNVSTDLATSGGGIDMSGLTGTHNFSTSGGGLSLDGLHGTIRGRTSGGGIEVRNTGDQVDLATSGGGITAVNCSGSLTLSTSGGSIELNKLDGSISAKTSGGPIRASDIKGQLDVHTSGGGLDLMDLECSLDASTSGGNIEVVINKLQDFVTVRNSGGSVRVTMPGDKGLDLKLRGDRIDLQNMRNFNGDQEDHKVEGKVNGGGVPVSVETSGKVTVTLN